VAGKLPGGSRWCTLVAQGEIVVVEDVARHFKGARRGGRLDPRQSRRTRLSSAYGSGESRRWKVPARAAA
jgi:hypothetical protein